MGVCARARASGLDLSALLLQSTNSVCLQLGPMTQGLGWETLGCVTVTALLAASINESWKRTSEQQQGREMCLPVACQGMPFFLRNPGTFCNLVHLTRLSLENDLETEG